MSQKIDTPYDFQAEAEWRKAVYHALPVVALMLALFTYWFAIADRYFVFLYYHDMGPLVPDTSPFSRVTSSRYWMTGLVASGAVLLVYTAVVWLLATLFPRYRPPAWWRVWAVCAVVLVVGVPAITMTANAPTLPLGNGAQVTLVALIGVGLALWPSELAAVRPGELVWLVAAGFGLMMVWLLIVTGLRLWLRRSVSGAGTTFATGVSVSYLLMPVVHHLLGTDGYFYITGSDNFFARSILVQLLTWAVSGGLVLGLTWLRRRIHGRTKR